MSRAHKYSLKEQLNPELLYEKFLSFSSRERLFILLGIALLLIVLIILPISCASSKLTKLERGVLGHQRNMEELIERLKSYQASENRLRSVENQWKGRARISLASTLERLSIEEDLKKNVDSIKEASPVSEGGFEKYSATVSVSKVSLEQALAFLHKIESSAGSMKITKLQIKPVYGNRQLFDLSFDVTTYFLKEGS